MKKWLLRTLNKRIERMGKKGYQIDPAIGFTDLLLLMSGRGGQLLRGVWLRLWVKKAGAPLWVGKGVRVRHARHVQLGHNVFLGDEVTINGLCRQGMCIGSHVSIHARTTIDGTGVITELGEGLIIGNHVGISPGCYLQVRGLLHIEDDVIMGPGVSIFTENHCFTDTEIPIRMQGVTRGTVRIGHGTWIGANATILSGVEIGKNCVIAAGSVVNQHVADYTLVGGVPARLLKKLKDS
jgi:acetyltransferase-like isoleucine patch superfamily enzyme